MPQLHHLALTTADLTTGAAFYDAVFGVLGYKSGYTSDELRTWVGHSPEILLYPVEGDDTAPHTHGRPGLQHAAMEVENRAMVDAVHEAVVAGGGTVVHAPREYDYAEGYYAVFVTDSDGNRWEFAHIPTPTQ
ncbi:VOC family protein [Streptosporangium lutulentum]|uniref:Catechol 2,3-dioxygenase-like lactoylglutathione lyase family enzyme n=1 Tax=Streptosporangium lutulentum TaxID=1461250 RepID=A0ABT9QUH2_9ACTN|nr:VOC family protein [Streptosporangium lutulentum]MDP9850418.1 catechol 2,3-dioxygenase-like lactoylglutathione lyase family enzyme [Streptosporangium lutulentum]